MISAIRSTSHTATLLSNTLRPTLALCALGISLLLAVSTAQAAEVILEGNNVIRIEDLVVFEDQGGPTTYDVHFVYAAATSVYGSGLDFDFNQEEDAFNALKQVMDALNANSPRPVGAGPNGTDQFFIGAEEDDGLVAAVGGENFAGLWDNCDIDCLAGTKILARNTPYTYADFRPAGSNPPPPSSGPVDLSGEVQNASGTPLCSMVLASGQFQFTCNPNGPYSLPDLPREGDGTVKRQVYVDGFFPKIDVLQGSTNEVVVMQRAGTCPNYNDPSSPGNNPGSAGDRVNISGQILLQNSNTPICAMVLANGQFQFSCDGTGNYALNIPLDANGQFKLQVYADGFAPEIQVLDEFKRVNDVRLARASECN
jgi:hypothetical protein